MSVNLRVRFKVRLRHFKIESQKFPYNTQIRACPRATQQDCAKRGGTSTFQSNGPNTGRNSGERWIKKWVVPISMFASKK